MADPNLAEVLSDPLSDISRVERRNLLVSSVIGVLVARAGLIPQKISVLDIEFSPPQQSTFVVVLAAVIFYFLSAFILYGAADFFVWWKRYYDFRLAVEQSLDNWTLEDQHHYDEMRQRVPNIEWQYRWYKPAAFFRVILEFVLPVAVSATSIGLLTTKIL